MGLKGIGLVFDFVFTIYFELVSAAGYRGDLNETPNADSKVIFINSMTSK